MNLRKHDASSCPREKLLVFACSILFLFVFKALFSLPDTHGRLLLLESFSIEKKKKKKQGGRTKEKKLLSPQQ